MYYAPRLAPEKPGMPVLGYFTVVGGILLGLMFVADAYMPRHEHLSFVSNVDGLPAAYKGEPTYVVAAAPHICAGPRHRRNDRVGLQARGRRTEAPGLACGSADAHRPAGGAGRGEARAAQSHAQAAA